MLRLCSGQDDKWKWFRCRGKVLSGEDADVVDGVGFADWGSLRFDRKQNKIFEENESVITMSDILDRLDDRAIDRRGR